METTLIILKPDAVQRGLMGELLSRFENKGLSIVGMKFIKVPAEVAEKHYSDHADKPFFPALIDFITASPVLVLAINGPSAISVCRNLIGPTDGTQAPPGTIRGDFGLSKQLNLVHGSDSPEAAEKELGIWFTAGEIVEWEKCSQSWVSG